MEREERISDMTGGSVNIPRQHRQNQQSKFKKGDF